MEQSLLERNLEEVGSEALDALEGQPVRVRPAGSLPSYRPTPWAIVNRALDIVDRMSGGRAVWVQRFFSFAFIGGCAALVNLIVYATIMHGIKLPVNIVLHNAIAFVFASELSIMANFIPNDYFTFRHLDGHKRSWFARCARFHLTAIGGTLLTYLIQFVLIFLAHLPAIIAQATALILVLFYNFTFHHLFTYRRLRVGIH
ncbi:MAG: GtrA family protein [Ktedonobacteraceae bacterium]|nr:GtrA family protein [Ktedonobacteraceae bacterium]